jgi:hypothetical protein
MPGPLECFALRCIRKMGTLRFLLSAIFLCIFFGIAGFVLVVWFGGDDQVNFIGNAPLTSALMVFDIGVPVMMGISLVSLGIYLTDLKRRE